MSEMSFQTAKSYLQAVEVEQSIAGAYLLRKLIDYDISQLTVIEFIELLINTKLPQIFAESAVFGDGQDWNQTELSLLGDISIAVPVTVFDNGLHYDPSVHESPFNATLLYVPGALLRNDRDNVSADWEETTINGKLNSAAYYALYERRLLPSFIYANDAAMSKNKHAFITIPGLGCGQFAGKFQGQLGTELRRVLIEILEKFSSRFSNIRAVYFDPYSECVNERVEIDHLSFFVRPLTKGNDDKPQLCEPSKYEDNGDDFSDCELYSFVAWDHVSWPGNDFYIGSRATDDGVKAAATDSMAVMTGITGRYHMGTNTYDPPGDYGNWGDVVMKNGVKIHARGNLSVV